MLRLSELKAALKIRAACGYGPGDAHGDREERRAEDYRPKSFGVNKGLSVPTPVEIIDDYTGSPLLVPRGMENYYRPIPTKKNLL